MSIDKTKILKGTSGKVWLNGKLLAYVKKIETKVTGNFEDIDLCGEYATQHIYTGWDGEGTITLQKIDSSIVTELLEAYTTGVMPEYKIIASVENPATNKVEKISIEAVDFTEFSNGFEAKTLIEEELPFKFSKMKVLDKIN